MFISFAALALSMITLPTTCYATPSLVTSYGDDVQLGVQVDSYIESYSGNNEFHVRCYNLRTLTPYGTLGDYQMLTYVFTINDGNNSSDFAIQYQFGGNNYDTLQVTTYVKTYSGAFGQVPYDNLVTSNIYLQDCWLKYNNGVQEFGDIYYTASDFYSTSRQNISGWNLTDATLIDSFEFGFNIVFFPPTFRDTDTDAYQDGYYQGYNQGKTDGYDQGFEDGEYEGYQDGVHDGMNAGETLGYQNGYTDGRASAIEQGATASIIFNGIISVALLPVNVFLKILNFEVFGINIGGFVSSLLTIMVVIIIVRMFLGAKNGDE